MGRHNLGPFRDAAVCDCGDHGFVGLTRGFIAYFDPDALPLVVNRTWCLLIQGRSDTVYARTSTGGAEVLMHRLLAGAETGQHVDHRDHDGLNNRSENIRACANVDNYGNARKRKSGTSSRFKGVSFQSGAWSAEICVDRVRTRLGRYADESDAARAYDRAAVELRGPFACTNASLGLLTEAAE